MSHFDHLNNDLLALIAQFLSVEDLLYFIRTHRRLHSLNNSNNSWCSRVFQYSHVTIELYEEWKFHEWLMKSHEYVYSVEAEISPSEAKVPTIKSGNFILFRFLLNFFRSCRRHWKSKPKLTEREIAWQLHLKRVNKGLISLSTWHSIKHGFCYVLNRWFNEHADEMKNWYCGGCYSGYNREKFDMELAKKIIETRDNPATTIITLESGEQCEVLTEFNENILKHKISARFAPCYRSRLILLATPNLRSLSFNIDAAEYETPQFDDLLGLVPNLRTLTLYQGDSNQSNTHCSLIRIRQTMKYLSELESLTINSFILSIQDLIDISSHPRLEFIELDDDEIDEGIDQEEWKWFSSSYKFSSEESPNHEHNDRINVDYQLADDKNNETIEKAAMNEFRVDGDDGKEDFIDEDNDPRYDAWKPAQMSADIEHIQSSLLLLPSSAASIKARLKLFNLLRTKLFRPHNARVTHPLKYLRHLRHQIYLLYSSLTQSLNDCQ